MNSFFNSTSGLWALRQLLQFGGAWLTFMGYASGDDVQQAMGALDQLVQLVGPLSFLIGFAGNVYSSFRDKVTVKGQNVGIGTIDEVQGQGVLVKEIAKEAISVKPTLWERITSGFNR